METEKNMKEEIEELEEELTKELEEELLTSVEDIEEEEEEETQTNEENITEDKKPTIRMAQSQKDLEILYSEFEKLKTEAKEKQDRAKEIKDEIINIMDMIGKDEVIINGLDTVVQLEITYPEREILNKKNLAEHLNIKQKELSKPQTIIELTKQGKITTEMIEQFTEVEERMQFSAKEYNPNEDN